MKFPWKAARLLLLAAILILTPLTAFKKTNAAREFPVKSREYSNVVTIWNIDTFEGGTGSRSDFLNARAVEFASDGVIYMVVSHTPESAETALANGNVPAMISFGTGLDFIAGKVKKLNVKFAFSGGEIGGVNYAVPWCAGGYFLLRINGDNRPINKLIVSDGTRNIALGAVYGSVPENVETITCLEPFDAYCAFVAGEAGVALLGTQRDIKRLNVRGVNYTATPLERFCDLYQYIAITAETKETYELAEKFIEYLISVEVQNKLARIFMRPVVKGATAAEELSVYNGEKTTATISAFTSAGVIENLRADLLNSVNERKKSQTFENALKDPRNACK